MKLGVQLPNAGGLARDGDAAALVALAEAAERLGFDSLWVSDQLATPVRAAGGEVSAYGWREEQFEPIAMLAGVAARTRRITLGTLDCRVPLRNPLVLAKEISTLDCIAKGRLIFGIAEGGLREEFRALGVEEHFEERAAVTDEWIAVCRAAWLATDEPTTFEGRYFRFGHIGAYPKPVQQPHPPIYIRDGDERAAGRVAEYGSGLITAAATSAELAEAAGRVRAACEERGRDPAEIDVCVSGVTEADPGRIAEYEAAGATRVILDLASEREAAPSLREAGEALERAADELLPAVR